MRRLEASNLLCRELACDPEINKPEANAAKLVDALWDVESGLANSLSPLHRAAEEALRKVDSDKRERLRLDIRDTLGLALLGMLNIDSRDQVLKPSHDFLDTDFLEFSESKESQPETVELCFATAQPKVNPMLKFDEESGHPQLKVDSERYYDRNKVEAGPKFSCDSTLDAQLKMVWGLHFPHEKKQSDEYLSDDDLIRLGDSLERKFKNGKARYYLVPHDDETHPLNEAGVISALKYKLPYLFVFRTGVSNQPRLISAKFHKFAIKDQLTEFADLFSTN